MRKTITVPENNVGLAQIILYSLAGLTFNLYDTILYAWLPYFYIPPQDKGLTQYIPLAALGILLAGGRILDAVTDPLVGYMSDHTRSRWGRRKPYICISNPILFLAFILVWVPPVHGNSMTNAIFLGIILFIYYISYTGMLIPWFAVLPEMSPINSVRVKIASIGVAIGVVGSLIGGGLSGVLFEKMGPFAMALILGVIGLVAGQLTIFGVKEHYQIQQQEEPPGFLKVVKEVFIDRQVLSFAVMIMLVQLTYQLMLMNVPYLTTLILGRSEADASILMGEVLLSVAVSVPFWHWLLRKFSKRRLFRIIILWMVAGFTLCFFIGIIDSPTPFIQAMIVFPLATIPMGGMFITVLGIIADLTDYDELKTGKRREAIYYGIYGIVRKTGWAMCSLILVGVFAVFGYSAENPLGVRIIWLVCALSCLIGLLAFIPYKLGDSKEETRAIMSL
ncbi:MAG: MFS transporter [Deltaproteobacteria bacterium]|nr:MFS transporter [Deltaproteobacteria bacterium]